jgi:hypothetical protein
MPTPRETVRLHFPWDVPTPLQINPAYHLIRTHGFTVLTDEGELIWRFPPNQQHG